MAITFEEKKPVNLGTIVIVIVLFIIIVGGAYFLFFAAEPFVEVLVPSEQKTTTELAKISFNPAALINSEAFKALRPYITKTTSGNTGRPNPFVKF